MSRFDAVIFDMDGVIVDSEPLHAKAFQDVFREMGYENNHGMDFTDYYGRSDRTLWADFIARHHPPQPLEELLQWKQRHFLELLQAGIPVIPQTIPLLRKLAPKFKLALASGSPHVVIQEVLNMENLRQFFPVVVSVQDVGKSKPAPDVFLRTAQLLGTDAARCCVIEDAAHGIEAALAAGMSVVAITNSLPPEKLSRATKVVREYEQIAEWLLEERETT